MSEPLIVIGNGMAAARFVEELAKRALGRYAVAVIGDEPRLAYNRVLLSALLAEEIGFRDIELKPARWWRDRGVTLRYGVRATAVDPIARQVTLSNGTRLSFSKLVFATGSQPIKLAIPGMDLPGVLTFRDIDDVNTIAKAARARVVVIGGGLLGLEAAYGLAKARAHVTVLHLMDRLMERQLDERAARMLKRAVEAKGIAVRLEAETARIIGNGRVEAVELRDGSVIPADAVVVAAGIRANTELARTGLRSIAALPSTTISRPASTTSTPSANAPSIAGAVTGWSSPPTSRPRCWRGGSRARTPLIPAACSPPI
jgi:nitrite reductase (NADH) large subunit